MGQLERYGLYVLVVVIALILGVAIIGDPNEVNAIDDELARQEQDDWNTPKWGQASGGNQSAALDVPFDDLERQRQQKEERRRRLEDGSGGDDLRRLDGDPSKIDSLFDEDFDRKEERRDERTDRDGTNRDRQDKPDVFDRVDPEPTPEPQPVAGTIHRVKRGDNSYRIARAQYGDASEYAAKLIKEANPGVNWNRLQLNSEIIVPPYKPRKQSSKISGKPVNPDTVIVHTIRQGDTLSGLARKYLGSESKKNIDAIRALNRGINARKLFVGKTVRIPRRSR